MSLQNILEGCKKQERSAQKQLFYMYAPQMMVVCVRYLKQKHEAEEAMLLGFEKFFARIDFFSFEGDVAFAGYLKKIMVNECLMLLRKKKIVMEEITEILPLMSDEESAIEKFSAKEIFNLVLKLPQGYGTVFNLFVIENRSHKEIAEALGITEGTSKSQLSKARAMLQKMITTNEKF